MSDDDLYVITLGLDTSGPLFEIHLFYHTLKEATAAFEIIRHESGAITDNYGTTVEVDTKVLFVRIASLNATAKINATQGRACMRAQGRVQAELQAETNNVVTLTPVNEAPNGAFNPNTLKGK